MKADVKSLIGIGLYTPADAGRLLGLSPQRITRWLRGHERAGTRYEALWKAQADLGEDGLFLGFRDLQEVRVAATFIEKGLSPQRVRQAIGLARDLLAEERPLSIARFRTDGRSVFLQVLKDDGQERLVDLFKGQFAFRNIIEQSLTNLEYGEGGLPTRWWPLGKQAAILLDPAISFGQPVEAETNVPVEVLASAVRAEGSARAAARTWQVPIRAVTRALAFQEEMDGRQAA